MHLAQYLANFRTLFMEIFDSKPTVNSSTVSLLSSKTISDLRESPVIKEGVETD